MLAEYNYPVELMGVLYDLTDNSDKRLFRLYSFAEITGLLSLPKNYRIAIFSLVL